MPPRLQQLLARTLSDDLRRRAFAVVAAVVVVVVAALAALPADRTSKRDRAAPPSSATPTPTQIVGATTPSATTPERAAPTATATTPRRAAPRRRLTARDQAAITAGARAFLRAYLRYEVGATGPAVHRALRRSATQAFARELLGHPPRLPAAGRPRAARIDGLELSDDPRARTIWVAATIDRSGVLSPLDVQLDRRDGAWRVVRLG